jgi:hypothetical protein
MKMSSHLWEYIAELFLEWQMFWTNVLQKIKTHKSHDNLVAGLQQKRPAPYSWTGPPRNVGNPIFTPI